MGYSIAVLLQIWIVAKVLRFIGCFVCLASACFTFSLALSEDIKDDIHSINKIAQNKPSLEHIRKKFIEFIRFTDLKWQDSFTFEFISTI